MGSETVAAVAAFMMGLIVAYIWWTHIRVMLLRQSLFEIRDRLFDEVAALGGFCDPAYKEARERLNGLIRVAGTISLPTFIYAAGMASKINAKPFARSNNAGLQKAIDDANKAMTAEILVYIVRYTLTGFAVTVSVLIFFTLFMIPKRIVIDPVQRFLRGWIESGFAETLSSCATNAR